MDFSSDANANFEGLLDVNRGICMPQMAEKDIARRAAELCGVALRIQSSLARLHGWTVLLSTAFPRLPPKGGISVQKIRFLPLLCVLLMLFTAPTLLAQQEPDTPYPAETMLSVRMMPPGERSLRNFLYPKLMAQEASIQLPAGTSYNLLVQTLDNMRNDYPELFHIDSYRVHYQRNQPDVAQSISPRYLCSAEEASALRKQLLETAQSWVDENPDPLALYERLVLSATYSPDSMWQHTAVGALLYGEATCAGYAQAISLLYRLAGIPCATIIGEASDTSGETGLHAWNVTNFGFLDATWGAAFDGHVFHSNYAMGEADMSIDHTPNRGYTFPRPERRSELLSGARAVRLHRAGTADPADASCGR